MVAVDSARFPFMVDVGIDVVIFISEISSFSAGIFHISPVTNVIYDFFLIPFSLFHHILKRAREDALIFQSEDI